MISERKLAANRENARKSKGPRTEQGKARASRNAFRHGLASTACDLEALLAAQHIAEMLCGPNASLAEREQAATVAECQVIISRVRAARAVAIDHMRIKGAAPYIPAYIWQEQTDKMREQLSRKELGKPARKIQLLTRKARAIYRQEWADEFARWRSLSGAPVLENGIAIYEKGERVPRDDCESIRIAIPQLIALERYEKRALSRRRRAIEILEAIKHMAEQRSDQDIGGIRFIAR